MKTARSNHKATTDKFFNEFRVMERECNRLSTDLNLLEKEKNKLKISLRARGVSVDIDGIDGDQQDDAPVSKRKKNVFT